MPDQTPTQSSTEHMGWLERRARVLQVLTTDGPMRAADVAERLGWDLREVSAKLQDLRRDGKVDRDEERSSTRLWWTT